MSVQGTAANPYIGPDAGTIGQCLASGFRGSINAYVGTVEAKAQLVQWQAERLAATDGYGCISGGAISAGAGLSVTVAAFEALIGNYTQTTGPGTVGGLTDNATSTVYAYQDGHLDTHGTATAHGLSMPWGAATTASGSVASVSQARRHHTRQYGGTAIPINSTGTITLDAAQVSYPSLVFAGTAVGTVVVVAPAQAGAAWDVRNNGTASLQFQAASGGSVVVSPSMGGRITYDGTDMQHLADARHRWTDCMAQLTGAKLAGVKDPGFDVWVGGVRAYAFDAGTEEEAYISVQVPHDYVTGSDFIPHIHWTPKTSGTGLVQWGLEYTVGAIGSVFSASGTLLSDSVHPTPIGGTLVANTHYLTTLGTVSGAGLGLSFVLQGRLFRNATGTADTYGADAFGLSFDLHYQSDGLGSRYETTK